MIIGELKTIDELEFGDQFLTVLNERAVKLTVDEINGESVFPKELGGIGITQDEYYVLV